MNKVLMLGVLWLMFFTAALNNGQYRQPSYVPDSLVLRAKAEMIDILNRSLGNEIQIQSVYYPPIFHSGSVNVTIYVSMPSGLTHSCFCLPCFLRLCGESDWMVERVNYGVFLKCTKEWKECWLRV